MQKVLEHHPRGADGLIRAKLVDDLFDGSVHGRDGATDLVLESPPPPLEVLAVPTDKAADHHRIDERVTARLPRG